MGGYQTGSSCTSRGPPSVVGGGVDSTNKYMIRNNRASEDGRNRDKEAKREEGGYHLSQTGFTV